MINYKVQWVGFKCYVLKSIGAILQNYVIYALLVCKFIALCILYIFHLNCNNPPFSSQNTPAKYPGITREAPEQRLHDHRVQIFLYWQRLHPYVSLENTSELSIYLLTINLCFFFLISTYNFPLNPGQIW